MIIRDKFNGNCDATVDLSTKIDVLSETKDVNVTVFDVITIIKKAKSFINIFHVIVDANSIVEHVIHTKKKE